MSSLTWTVSLLVLAIVTLSAASSSCPQPCLEILQPVCGTDNKTYSNLCELRNAICQNRRLRKLHDGDCKSRRECPIACTADYDPVCGTDGKTYSNACNLGIVACQNPHLNLRVAKDDECLSAASSSCPQGCREILQPVCGTDNKTYSNLCELRKAICQNRRLRKLHDGDCKSRRECPIACTANYDPVCGTDGKTYSNACNLGIVACENPHLNLRVAKDGEC